MVVISYGLWQRRFGRDPSLVGRTITLDAVNLTVVGIMLPGSKYPNVTSRNAFFQQALARLEALAGVRSAGAISDLPLGGTENLTWLAVEGHAPAPRGQEPEESKRLSGLL